jgi:hypothetical protein
MCAGARRAECSVAISMHACADDDDPRGHAAAFHANREPMESQCEKAHPTMLLAAKRAQNIFPGWLTTERPCSSTMEFPIGSGASVLGFKRYLLGELDILPDAPLRDAQSPAAGFVSGALVRMAARGAPGGFRRTAARCSGGKRFAAKI